MSGRDEILHAAIGLLNRASYPSGTGDNGPFTMTGDELDWRVSDGPSVDEAAIARMHEAIDSLWADEHRRNAERVRDEALARQRAELDARWTWWRPKPGTSEFLPSPPHAIHIVFSPHADAPKREIR